LPKSDRSVGEVSAFSGQLTAQSVHPPIGLAQPPSPSTTAEAYRCDLPHQSFIL